MTKLELDLKPVSHITSDAIGAPGARVFYIQGWQNERPQPVTVIIEKIQLQSLVLGIEKMLADLGRKDPALNQAMTEPEKARMQILPPVDPIFRAGEIGIGYDEATDLVILMAKEILPEDGQEESASVVRFWCTRAQMQQLARWSLEVIKRGRPICPQCGQPMEPEGHFCPKKNGHKH